MKKNYKVAHGFIVSWKYLFNRGLTFLISLDEGFIERKVTKHGIIFVFDTAENSEKVRQDLINAEYKVTSETFILVIEDK